MKIYFDRLDISECDLSYAEIYSEMCALQNSVAAWIPYSENRLKT